MRVVANLVFSLILVSVLGCSTTQEVVQAPSSDVTASESVDIPSKTEDDSHASEDSSSRIVSTKNQQEALTERDGDRKKQTEKSSSDSVSLGLDQPRQVPLEHYKRQLHEPKTIDPTADRLFQNPPSERRRKQFEEKQRLKAEAKKSIPTAAVGGGLDPVADARFETLEVQPR